MFNKNIIYIAIIFTILIFSLTTIYFYYTSKLFKQTKILNEIIVNLLFKSILYILSLLSYLFLYYSPNFEKNIKKIINNSENNLEYDKMDIIINYTNILLLLIISLILFLTHYNKSEYKSSTYLILILEIVFGGLFTLYIVHWCLEEYSFNIYEILKDKLN